VIWHLVRFDCSGIDGEARRAFEASLESLAELDEVAWLRVGRDLEDPNVTGLLTGFVDVDALAAYRVDPRHQVVLDRIRELGLPTWRLDVATDDDPARLA
jgi:hypothetical protein